MNLSEWLRRGYGSKKNDLDCRIDECRPVGSAFHSCDSSRRTVAEKRRFFTGDANGCISRCSMKFPRDRRPRKALLCSSRYRSMAPARRSSADCTNGVFRYRPSAPSISPAGYGHPSESAPLVLAPPPIPAVAASLAEVSVKKGDTLEKIAKAHHTTVEELRRLNQLPNSFLRIGQVLKLPGEKSFSQTAKAKSVSSEKQTAQRDLEYYTVKVGDNPWTIAMKHRMKVDELLKLNGLNEEKARRLKPGDRLRVR